MSQCYLRILEKFTLNSSEINTNFVVYVAIASYIYRNLMAASRPNDGNAYVHCLHVKRIG